MEVPERKRFQHLCEPCGGNGQTLLAEGFCVDCSEFLCIDCCKHHHRAKAYRNHQLQYETSMLKTKHGSTPLKPADNENACLKHKGEIIKFYCRTDRKFGCGSCIALDHNNCDKPVYIQEEYKKFETKLDKLNDQLEYHTNKKDQLSAAMKSLHSKVSRDIKLFMKKVKAYFENLETSMITEADKLKDTDEQNMNVISTNCMTLNNDIHLLTSDLHQTKLNEKLFTMMEESGDQMKKISMNFDQMNEANKIQLYAFLPEGQIEDMMKTLTTLGQLAIENETDKSDVSMTSLEDIIREESKVNPIQPISKPGKIDTKAAGQNKPFKPREASYSTHINNTSSTDEQNNYVTSLALLPNNHLILIDNYNMKVKLVSPTRGKVISELELPSKPQDITAINDNQVAMTMPEANQIQILSTSQQNIFLGQTIKVKGQCHGIVHNEGTLIVTFVSPAKVEVISMSGVVLRVVYKKKVFSKQLFEKPHYIDISLDKTHVYISDYAKHSVTCMTLDGEVKGVYKNEGLKNPRGLTVDKTGSVYVVGEFDTYDIYQLSADCSQGCKLLGFERQLWMPRSIAYCHKEDKLYVGQWMSAVHVFQLK